MEELEKLSPLRAALQSGSLAAVLDMLPIVGAAVQGALSGATHARWVNRVVEEAEKIDKRIDELEERVHQDYITSDEFKDLVADAMSEAARFESEERRRLYSSVVVGAAVAGPGSHIVARRMMRRIEALDPIHFKFLKGMALAENLDPDLPVTHTAIQWCENLLSKVLGRLTGGRVESLLFDLQSEGLLRPEPLEHLRTMRSSFTASDARRWISSRGQETLRYLWPEDANRI